ASRVEEASTPILVADWDPQGVLEKQLTGRYNARRVPIRAWWFPEAVRAAVGGPVTHPTPREFLRWWLFHEIWSPIGSQDATFYVRKDLEGTGPLEPIALRVLDTSARDYSSEASTIAAAHEWGREGSGPGELSEPRGLASDTRGNLYVADTKNNRIQIFDGNGQWLRQVGTQGSGDGQFKEPCGAFVDPDGGLWVADTWNQRIAHVGPDGQWLGSVGGPENGFFGPRAVLVSRGFLYVADTGNKRIVRFDLRGNRLSTWGGDGTGPGQFVEPVGLAADASGNVYVADTGNHRVQVFDAEGKFLRQFPVSGWKEFYTEPYIAVGPSDTLFATDSSASRIAEYDTSGAFRRSWKPERGLKQPTGIAIDPFGRLTVSDRGTHRLFSWPLTAVVP
ncbi:MAG TPA: NHL repeat-containing protein, partial [Thermoanaerobaculia bacterium]|nr:NHL repeat-containing protein [Thermoanaerobaculia bacterium]